MTILQNTPERLVVQAGSLINQCTLTLDRASGNARLDRKLLLWPRKPVEFALADIDHVDVITSHDPASGADTHLPVLHRRTGAAITVPVAEAEARSTATQLRGFLGLAS
ncbi:MAG: hypothetical protein K2Z80_24320 [Xanthobacteraceae bacterium]|nr:hypothetical protein [Xanthobacteraceae bacterium]